MPRSMSTATVADRGPLTSFHKCLLLERALNVRFHITVRDIRQTGVDFFHIRIQERICSSGMLTRGSAVSREVLDRLNAHLIAEVAHAPALMHPVAVAVLDLHLSTFEGAMPTAVWPYF